MGNYAVFLEGKNFALRRGREKELFGFFVTVRIEAHSEPEAKIKATALVESDPQLVDGYKADANVASTVEVKIVHELLPENKMKNTEFVFFPIKET